MAFGAPDQLEQSLLSGNEILFTAEASKEEVQRVLSGLDHITQVQMEEKEGNRTLVQLKTDSRDMYQLSRQLFFAFAEENRALLEMSLKKASLEDIFLELTESGVGSVPTDSGAGKEEEEQS